MTDDRLSDSKDKSFFLNLNKIWSSDVKSQFCNEFIFLYKLKKRYNCIEQKIFIETEKKWHCKNLLQLFGLNKKNIDCNKKYFSLKRIFNDFQKGGGIQFFFFTS